jgi:hypothetical protein
MHRLLLGVLPKPLLRAQRWRDQFRRELEAEVVSVHGSISFVQAARIGAAATAEAGAAVCRHLMQHRWDEMSTADVLACVEKLTRFIEARNKILDSLKLEPEAVESLATLYFREPPDDVRPPTVPPAASEPPSTAPETSSDVRTLPGASCASTEATGDADDAGDATETFPNLSER